MARGGGLSGRWPRYQGGRETRPWASALGRWLELSTRWQSRTTLFGPSAKVGARKDRGESDRRDWGSFYRGGNDRGSRTSVLCAYKKQSRSQYPVMGCRTGREEGVRGVRSSLGERSRTNDEDRRARWRKARRRTYRLRLLEAVGIGVFPLLVEGGVLRGRVARIRTVEAVSLGGLGRRNRSVAGQGAE
jgi:hypothetical protein